MAGTKYILGPDINLDAEEFYDEDGTRITPSRADQIAKEVLNQAGKRGRRSLTGKAGPISASHRESDTKDQARTRKTSEGPRSQAV